MSLAQTVTAEPPPSTRTADTGGPLDLSKETFSIAEAARFVDHEECVMHLLCRRGVVPTHEVEGERRIKREDLMAYYREEEAARERFRRSPFLKEMRAISAELMDKGLYWKATPEVLAQHQYTK